MSEAASPPAVRHLFHWTTAGVTFAAVFALFVLMPVAAVTAAFVSLLGLGFGAWHACVPGRLRLPFQRVGLPVGRVDGLLAVLAFGGPLSASALVLLG